ncbi:MAG: DNA alkylation repair protein [Patescibacteria group bacterium]
MNDIAQIRRDLRSHTDRQKARHATRFFRTGKGEYGEGDRFLGITVPAIRRIIKIHPNASINDAFSLLTSPWHEERLAALCILVRAYRQALEKDRKAIVKRYLSSTQYINNWDLVDVTAPHIVGEYFLHRSHAPLIKLARSSNLWKKRIAIVSTHRFIREHDLDSTFMISNILLNDTHDLIHKAVGWMLREAGKRDINRLRSFLRQHVHVMPRTMLRYAIEKLSESERRKWLEK